MTISNQASGIRTGVCTSTTRPVIPYDGQVIYETDTDRTLVWNNSAWVFLSTSTANPVGLELVSVTTVSSSVPSIQINSCFTSNYDNYKVVFANMFGSASQQTLLARLTLNGTPSATGYDFRGYYVTYGGSNGMTGRATTEFTPLGVDSSNRTGGVFELQSPALATWTTAQTTFSNYDAWVSQAGRHAANTAYDGLYLVAASGNITGGTVSIYGYKK